MARITEQSIEKVRQAADIVEVVSGYVDLKQKGRNFFGLCPFHNEKTPSFSVNPEKQIYKCFGCGAGGGSINFIMALDNLEFVDAVKHLAENYNVILDIKGGESKNYRDLKSQIISMHQIAANYYQDSLKSKNGQEALTYLKERGLTQDMIDKFKIGFSPDSFSDLLEILRKESYSAEAMNKSGLFISGDKGYFNRFRSRIMFPIQDYRGSVIAFGGRIFNKDDPAKYQNSPETPIYTKSNVLYGLHQNADKIKNKKQIILVEGYMDLLQLSQAGADNCLAISGTAFTEGHASILKRYTNDIYVTFDGDDAGQKASIRCGYILTANSLNPRIITPPNRMDPDDWIREKGYDEFMKGFELAEDIIKAHFNYFSANSAQGSLSINEFIQECLNEIINIKDPIIQELIIKRIAELTSIDQKNIVQVLNEKINKKNRFKSNSTDTEISVKTNLTADSSIPVKIYDDVIRLCFSEDKVIREFLFENFNPDWIKINEYRTMYDKAYIHLKANEGPPLNVIVEQIDEKIIREKLIDITFDLDRFEPTLEMAIDCLVRIEKTLIQNQINALREKLKSSANDEQMNIINQLSALEKNIQKISKKYNAE